MKTEGFIASVRLMSDQVVSEKAYPFSIPSVAALAQGLTLNPRATFLVGENGSGKSTVMEAIAVAAGFNAEGGTVNFNFATRAVQAVDYEETDAFLITKRFTADPSTFLEMLLGHTKET